MGCWYRKAVKCKIFQKTHTFWSWEKNRLFCSLWIRYLPAETVLVLVLHRELFSVALSFGPFALLPPFPNPVLGLSSQCHWTHLSLWHQGNKQSEQCRLTQRSFIFFTEVFSSSFFTKQICTTQNFIKELPKNMKRMKKKSHSIWVAQENASPQLLLTHLLLLHSYFQLFRYSHPRNDCQAVGLQII